MFTYTASIYSNYYCSPHNERLWYMSHSAGDDCSSSLLSTYIITIVRAALQEKAGSGLNMCSI